MWQLDYYMMMDIIVADTTYVLRFGMMNLIKGIIPSVRVYEAKSFGDIMDRLQERNIGLIISDVRVPGMENMEFIQKWRAVRPEVKILIFTDYDEKYNAPRFIKCGVNGFLRKESNQSEIKDAILAVINEGLFISKIAREMIVKATLFTFGKNVGNPFEQLSMKEKQVLGLMLKGYSPKEVARELKLHASTVSTYKRRIYMKVDVTNIPHLINKFKLYETY